MLISFIMLMIRVTFLVYMPKETISFLNQVLNNRTKSKVYHKEFVLRKTVLESDIKGSRLIYKVLYPIL